MLSSRREKTIVMAAVVLSAGTVATAIVDRPSRPERLTRLAVMSVAREGNVARAESLLHRIYVTEPTYAPAVFNLGVVAEARGDWREAVNRFMEYLARDSTSATAAAALREIDLITSRKAGWRNAWDDALAASRRLLLIGATGDASDAAHAALRAGAGWQGHAIAAIAEMHELMWSEADFHIEGALRRAPASSRAELETLHRELQRYLTDVHPQLHVSARAIHEFVGAALAAVNGWTALGPEFRSPPALGGRRATLDTSGGKRQLSVLIRKARDASDRDVLGALLVELGDRYPTWSFSGLCRARCSLTGHPKSRGDIFITVRERSDDFLELIVSRPVV